MAYIDNGFLRGQLGDVINRKVGDKNIVQTKATQINQSRWSKAASSDFGRASTAGALIRRLLSSLHQHMHDGKMHNRLMVNLQRVMKCNRQHLGKKNVVAGNPNRLVDFQFNDNSHLGDYMFFDIATLKDNNILTITVPSFHVRDHIKPPKKCCYTNLRIVTVAINFEKKQGYELGNEEIGFEPYYKDVWMPEQTFSYTLDDVDTDMVLVGVNLDFFSSRGSSLTLINDEKLNPASIIAAFGRTNYSNEP
ncbi:hypothetical protein FAZ19_14155 [Sphingobacterium alkalisoli]|uniref:Uncharacterized protein n=2 Tax=Sphingobacterium TaxID=28453 RepID=A0A4U0P0T3_9SPHI|nr:MULTISPECIES: hypothetical protein [Sphingobacterium]TJY64343.1 hypothetical protein FAZ19_14155 [Sphingobacterium alkalisoli]TJZ60640.1 hypothetical protein FAZ15_11650 [Sphingobacterium olei]GGH22310.1 hypothetical protein GCM10011418_28790 [Sphingobacterium alkalisoli]